MKKLILIGWLAFAAALIATAQPSYNNVSSMLSSVTTPVTLRNGSTLQTLGYSAARDAGNPLLWSWDATNTLATNRFRLAVGTNTVGRLVHTWNGDVRAFGAKADSGVTTNNSPFIQAAVNAAASLGIPLRIVGDGTNFYQIDEAIILKSKTSVILENAWIRKRNGVGPYSGDPYQASIFRNENLNESVDANLDPLTQDTDISIEGIGNSIVDGNGPNSLGQAAGSHPAHAFRFVGINKIKLKNFTIKDAAYFAILAGACRQMEVSGLVVTNAFTSRNGDADQGRNNDGISLVGCIDVRIHNNLVYSTDDCIALQTFYSNNRNVSIVGNVLHQMINSNSTWTPRCFIMDTGGTNSKSENVVFANNVLIANAGSGINIYKSSLNTSSIPVSHCIVANNIIMGNGVERATTYGNVAGVSLDGVSGVDIIGNTVSNFTGRMMWIRNAKRTRLLDNKFYKQQRQVVADGTPYAIYLDSSAGNIDDIEIRGGVIENTVGGISSLQGTNYYLTNVVIDSVRIATLNSNATTLSSSILYGAVHLFNAHRVRIKGLRIEDIGGAGISVLSGQDVEIDDNRIRGTDSPIILSGINRYKIRRNWITDQNYEASLGPSGAIYLWGNYGSLPNGEITGNHIENVPMAGVYSLTGAASTNLSINGNTFRNGASQLGSNDDLHDDYAAITVNAVGAFQVRGNEIQNWRGSGIRVNTGTNIVIDGNILDTIGTTTNGHGIWVSATDASTPVDLLIVSGNTVYSSKGIGLHLQSPKVWVVRNNVLWNNSASNSTSSDIFVDVNGATTVDTAGFSGIISGNTVHSSPSSTWGIRGQVRNLPAGVNGGLWNGTRWSVVGNSVTASSAAPYNFNPTLQAVGVVEGSPAWISTIGGSITYEGHHKRLDWFTATNVTVTLPSAGSMLKQTEFVIYKAGANTNQITIARTGSDVINGATSLAWTNQYVGYRFQAPVAGVWYVERID